jgi:8-oxo-dGTP diphosphatase
MSIQIGKDVIGVGAGALIFNEAGKFLMMKRGPAAKNEVGKWEIPGGAIEFGETFAEGIKREIKEEIGVEVEVLELLDLCDHILPDEHQHWVSPTYICQIVKGTPRIMEPEKCDDLGWFSIEEAEKLPLSVVTQKDIEALKHKKTTG